MSFLQSYNHGNISDFKNLASSVPGNDIHSFIKHSPKYLLPKCLLGYENELDRVLARILFLLLSEYFQLVYVSAKWFYSCGWGKDSDGLEAD